MAKAAEDAAASLSAKEEELKAATEEAAAALALKAEVDRTAQSFRQMAEDNAAELARKEDQRKAGNGHFGNFRDYAT